MIDSASSALPPVPFAGLTRPCRPLRMLSDGYCGSGGHTYGRSIRDGDAQIASPSGDDHLWRRPAERADIGAPRLEAPHRAAAAERGSAAVCAKEADHRPAATTPFCA